MLKSARFRSLLICLVLVLGVLFIYAPARSFEFVALEDPEYVINNFNIARGLSWDAFKWSFGAGYAGNWHPLTWLSLCLDCQLFGPKPGPMHVTNIVLHGLTAIFLFLALEEMTG